jgi:hypothetical protein
MAMLRGNCPHGGRYSPDSSAASVRGKSLSVKGADGVVNGA